MTRFTIVVKDGKNVEIKEARTYTQKHIIGTTLLVCELSQSVCECRLHFEVLDYTDMCIVDLSLSL